MDDVSKNFYSVGELLTFKTTFKQGYLIVEEYVHCIVLEHLESDKDGNPEVIKINQICNLQEYYQDGQRAVKIERVFRISDIEVIFNSRPI